MANEVYGFDAGHNKHEVATVSQLNLLAVEVGTKQDAFDLTEGAVQTDCDTIFTTGCYYITSATLNSPAKGNYFMVVHSMNTEHSIVLQQLFNMNANNYYIRTYQNGSWGLWREYTTVTS